MSLWYSVIKQEARIKHFGHIGRKPAVYVKEKHLCTWVASQTTSFFQGTLFRLESVTDKTAIIQTYVSGGYFLEKRMPWGCYFKENQLVAFVANDKISAFTCKLAFLENVYLPLWAWFKASSDLKLFDEISGASNCSDYFDTE